MREYGYSRDEFLKMTLLDIQPPEEAQKLIAAIEAGKATGLVVDEWRHRRKDGSVFDVEINAQSIDFRGRQARIVLARDITMRKRAIRALEISEGRFRKLFQHSLGLICTHDLEGVLISVNPAAARALDYSVGDLLGHNLADFMPPERRDEFARYIERLKTTGVRLGPAAAHWRATARCASGSTTTCSIAMPTSRTCSAMRRTSPSGATTSRNCASWHDRSADRAAATGVILDEQRPSSAMRAGVASSSTSTSFKQINDTYGHERGDQVLIGEAEFLRKHAPPGAIVVRMGGDEFLLLVDAASDEALIALADRLRTDASSAPSGFTLGCAVREAGETLESTLRRADAALYATRAAARGGGAQENTDA